MTPENPVFNFGYQENPVVNDGQLKFPPSLESQKGIEFAVDNFIGQKLPGYLWESTRYYSTLFDNLDSTAFIYGGTAADSNIFMDSGVRIQTSDSVQNKQLTKNIQYQHWLTFDKPQRFRTNFTVSLPIAARARIVVGTATATATDTLAHYGFFMDTDLNLKGSASSGRDSGYLTPTLQTIAAGSIYEIEARLLPADRVIFFVNGEERGVLSDPGGDSATRVPRGSFTRIFDMVINQDTGTNSKLRTSYFDFEQGIKAGTDTA